MAVYSKICVICSKDFTCLRINTMYCSKKCANRARSLPSNLMEALVRRSQKFTVNTMLHKGVGIEQSSEATDSNPAGKDLGLLVASAKAKATERGIKTTGFSTKDALLTIGPNKLANDKMKKVTEDNLKYINTEDAITDASGFRESAEGVGYIATPIDPNLVDNEMTDFKLPDVPQPKGLRKLADVIKEKNHA